ncbi:hypothetical protein [Streptomyces sp. NPDC057250]|uniref:hypothetical protein n=1 Tax=Streptomyces sp. NPDC057250 TaxID=3346068 RepID=UPI00362BF934
MGWGSAGIKIFDPVARALIDAGTDPQTREDVLADIIEALQNEDWDTQQDSLDLFLNDPPTVAAFARHGITHPDHETAQPAPPPASDDCGCGHDHWKWKCAKEAGGCGYASPFSSRDKDDALAALNAHREDCTVWQATVSERAQRTTGTEPPR